MSGALLVIDVQRELVDDLPAERRAPFLGVLGRLLESARAQGMPVVYVRHNDEYLLAGSDAWQIASEIAPRAGEPIVDKQQRDAFRDTNLDAVLVSLDARELVVCGMQTEYGVDATVREAERRGFTVTLVADGHATYAVDGSTEEQIRAQVHGVLAGRVARIVASAELLGQGERGGSLRFAR